MPPFPKLENECIEYDGPFPFQQAVIPRTVKNQVGNSIQELLIESDPFDPQSARSPEGCMTIFFSFTVYSLCP